MNDLIKEFQDIFTDLPRITNLGEHEIDSMLSMDIIEKSTTAYASPVVMVKKSDNSIKVCCDFRKLNKVTVFDPEPMTTADDIFVKLNGYRYFSKFDLSKGFWQVRMRESDKPYTTFITHQGLYQFKVMPFGLINSGAISVEL